MKSLVLALAMLLPIICHGQMFKDNDVVKNLDSLGLKYIEVNVMTTSLFVHPKSVYLDYGQDCKRNSMGNCVFVDGKNEPIKFLSRLEVLNYMSRFGWKVVAVRLFSDQGVHTYYTLMEKI